MDILLIGGLWLDGSAWDDVVPALEALGHRPVAITLPGQGDGTAAANLDDQVAAVVAVVDAAPRPVVVVGHSAACSLAWLAVDALPTQVVAAVLIGGFRSADGELYADYFPPVDGVVPFPDWVASRVPTRPTSTRTPGAGSRRRPSVSPRPSPGGRCTCATSAGQTSRWCSSAPSSARLRRGRGSTPATCRR